MLITEGNQSPDVEKYCCSQYGCQDINKNGWYISNKWDQPGEPNLLHFKVGINIEHVYRSIATEKLINSSGNSTAAEIEECTVSKVSVGRCR